MRRLHLSVDEDRKQLRAIFRLALEGAEGSADISAQSLMNGFRQGQLRKAFEAVEGKLKIGVHADTLRSYASKVGAESVFPLMRSLSEGEAAIIRLREPNHWVLGLPGSQAQFWVDDSSYGGDRRAIRMSVVEKKKIEIQRGLVLKNAQTH